MFVFCLYYLDRLHWQYPILLKGKNKKGFIFFVDANISDWVRFAQPGRGIRIGESKTRRNLYLWDTKNPLGRSLNFLPKENGLLIIMLINRSVLFPALKELLSCFIE